MGQFVLSIVKGQNYIENVQSAMSIYGYAYKRAISSRLSDGELLVSTK